MVSEQACMKITSQNNRRFLTLSHSAWLRVGQEAGWDENILGAPQSSPAVVSIDRYGNRNWAVSVNGELLAVTVYLKGARAVKDLIDRLYQQVAAGNSANGENLSLSY